MRKKKRKHIILISIIVVILVFFAVEFIKYLSLRTDAKKYQTMNVSIKTTDSLDVVGMLDSYGVPYSPEVDNSFFDIYAEELKKEGKLGSELDLFGLYLNKTWHLDGIFRNGVSIEEMTKMQNFAIDFNRHKYENRFRTDLNYSVSEEMGDMTVYDYVAGLDKPVICYSCSANDLFYYYGFSLEGLNAKRCIELVSGFDDAKVLLSSGVRNNIDTLLGCNPDSQIYILGLYVPSDNFFVQRIGSIAINAVNRDLKSICDQYTNVHFVDVSCVSFAVLDGDFHPNQEGQRIIANKLIETINDTYVSLDSASTSSVYRAPIHDTTETDYMIYVDTIVNEINNTSLPINDYVEAAVAIEFILNQIEIEQIDYNNLNAIKYAIVSRVNSDIQTYISDGLEICIIERKVLYGITESSYSSHPDTVLNDKISLIDYY